MSRLGSTPAHGPLVAPLDLLLTREVRTLLLSTTLYHSNSTGAKVAKVNKCPQSIKDTVSPPKVVVLSCLQLYQFIHTTLEPPLFLLSHPIIHLVASGGSTILELTHELITVGSLAGSMLMLAYFY